MQDQNRIKKCYIVGGLGCSGKTTLAEKMSLELGIPSFKADNVHLIVADKLGISYQELANLVMPKSWDKPLNSKVYADVRAVFKQAYLDFFNYLPPERFILEGESLFWNKQELSILQEILPDWSFRYFSVEPDYERWLKNLSKRTDSGKFSPIFRDEGDYLNTLREYQYYSPVGVWRMKDISDITCSPTGGIAYQSTDFSDPKWSVFPMPDLKEKSFLDLSCGTGWFCFKAKEAGAKEITGIDISWQLLDVAKERVPDGNFILGKVEDFIFDDGLSYDVILCASAFHYYHRREEVIKRISEKTGCFILELPVLDIEVDFIRYQGGSDGEFCSVPSKPLVLKWLKKYFKTVEQTGETIQPNSANRPVFLCRN